MVFKGSIAALVTPFSNGRVDRAAFAKLVGWHVAEGTHGILVNGTTGEAPALSADEQEVVITTAVKAAAGRVPVMAGVGTNNTEKSIQQAKRAATLGVDGLLVVSPYYNRPVQEGLFQHFSAVAKSVKLPLVIYNIPGRTGVNVAPETMERLMDIKNIVGVKDAAGDLKQAQELRTRIGPRLAIFSGDDVLNLPLASIGSVGAISVVANVVPRKMSEMYEAVHEGDFARAAGLHLDMFDLHKGLFVETNPIPVKAALNMMGKIGPEIRLPLTRLPAEKAAALRAVLKRHGAVR
jgi:4-hydroxy-tetrahydrodipicolinate synthase